MRTTVTYAGIDLEVIGTFMPEIKQGEYEPEQQAYIDEMSVKVNDIPITELISDDDFNKIQQLALEAVL
ncbi:MAG TPA: hypothetical protein VJ869_09890 [Sphaerochaeta sp.]|nr:hypothetical protein [Sphaerochaeta sp.]